MNTKLIKRTLFIVFVTMFLQKSFAASTSINFIQADYNTVAKLSELENKFFFVNYSADWCATCKVMEETSNANPELVNFIDKKFIAVKANVDNPQGKLWQTQYGVTCLPTLIVFSPNGQEVARKNGGITSSEFLVFLQQFETMPSQPVAVNIKPNAQVKTSTSDGEINSNNTSTYSNNSVANSNNSSPGFNNTFTEIKNTSSHSNNRVSNNSSMSSNGTVTNSISNSEFIAKGTSVANTSTSFSISTSKNYGVQVGMYSKLSNANLKIDKLKKQVNQPVMLRYEKVKGQTMYQVIVGEYFSENDATQFMSSLKSKGIKGYLIEL